MKYLNGYKEEDLHPDLVNALYNIERMSGQELVITSGKRTNSKAHKKGRGVDIRCHTSQLRFKILDAAFSEGFLRIGVYDRHIHLDLELEGYPQCVMWLGKSK
jgi:hypothetical protein